MFADLDRLETTNDKLGPWMETTHHRDGWGLAKLVSGSEEVARLAGVTAHQLDSVLARIQTARGSGPELILAEIRRRPRPQPTNPAARGPPPNGTAVVFADLDRLETTNDKLGPRMETTHHRDGWGLAKLVSDSEEVARLALPRTSSTAFSRVFKPRLQPPTAR